MGRAAVFLDRDGVINRSEVRDGKPYSPRALDDFRLLPGSVAAIDRLKQAGYLVVVVTNQPDIGNGFVAREVVEAMHRRLRERTLVDDVRMCPHSQGAGCDCRKPRPGMLLALVKDWQIDPASSWMVGDRGSDIVAGEAAGCRTIFIDRGYREPKPAAPTMVARTLPEAVEAILGHQRERAPATPSTVRRRQ